MLNRIYDVINKMAVSGDVTVAQDGGQGNVKLHPYLVALVRWCVSCLWSSATILLHRLMTNPLPSITASPKPPKARPPGTDHLHPEPKVECVVLHEPETHTMDVIFVHGLYGSLANTWRQGEWIPKYKEAPSLIPLRRPGCIPSPCNSCETIDNCSKVFICNTNEVFITEKFYNDTLGRIEIVDNYDAQVKFVKDLFDTETKDLCHTRCCKSVFENDTSDCCKSVFENDTSDCCNDVYENDTSDCCNGVFNNEYSKTEMENEFFFTQCCEDYCGVKSDFGLVKEDCRCENCGIGCGCSCDRCYSPCWPRDWIREDFPTARVISINYTSDPYLWRPLWVKQSKRLRLHERAQQMAQQLLALRVGERPIVWVGHSKGGLFIKQIYCEAYEAYVNENKVNFDKIISKDGVEHDNVEGRDNNCNEKNVIAFNHEVPQSKLWVNSIAFMFYSVPHRGSPLADIKTPITTRSIELLEMGKDCPLVLSLQDRWLSATETRRPVVRSLVETCRTLMSVLWLKIVSVDSADAGVGALCGVPVDHREICKPTSRTCILYTELTNLINAALSNCSCDSSQQ